MRQWRKTRGKDTGGNQGTGRGKRSGARTSKHSVSAEGDSSDGPLMPYNARLLCPSLVHCLGYRSGLPVQRESTPTVVEHAEHYKEGPRAHRDVPESMPHQGTKGILFCVGANALRPLFVRGCEPDLLCKGRIARLAVKGVQHHRGGCEHADMGLWAQHQSMGRVGRYGQTPQASHLRGGGHCEALQVDRVRHKRWPMVVGGGGECSFAGE